MTFQSIKLKRPGRVVCGSRTSAPHQNELWWRLHTTSQPAKSSANISWSLNGKTFLSYLFTDANWLADYRQIPRSRVGPILQPQRRKFSSAFRRQIEALAPSSREESKSLIMSGRDEVVKLILTKIWCRLVVKIMKISIVSSFLLSFSRSIPFHPNMFIRMYTLSSFSAPLFAPAHPTLSSHANNIISDIFHPWLSRFY